MRHENDPAGPGPEVPKREPVFNLPNVVLAMVLLMVAIQVALDSLLPRAAVLEIYLQTAFIPQRYAVSMAGQAGPYLWSPITYSLLHGGYAHLALNCFWLAAFGARGRPPYWPGPVCCFLALECIGVGGALFLVVSLGGPEHHDRSVGRSLRTYGRGGTFRLR
jgi:hypothetical protein